MSLGLHALPGNRRDSTPGVLILTTSHGFPPTQARLRRAAELADQITRRGIPADICVLLEKPLEPYEAEALAALRARVRDLEVVEHPALGNFIQRALARAAKALSRRGALGGPEHCPGRFLAALHSRRVSRGYRAVIACGVEIARALALFKGYTDRLLDLPRIGHDAWADHDRQGRGDALSVFSDGVEELDLLGLADAVLVGCAADAVRLRELGFVGDLVLAPPTGGLERLPPRGREWNAPPPIRPLRILSVGSDTTANLDGIRWFRRQVHPRVLKIVPASRLRLVGELARHIEPGPGVDRIGWVEDVHEEYRNAAVVVLPLRMGSGIHRRAVEALSHGKALVTLPVGARGLGLIAGRDAIVSDDASFLAAEIGRVLSSDTARIALEARSAAVAAESFDPIRSFANLAERLGLPEKVLDPYGAMPVPVRAASAGPRVGA
jgi:hypothetical protein